MKNLVEQCGRSVSEDQERKDEEVFWTSGQGQQESRKLHRCVSLGKMRRNSIVLAGQKAVCGMQITNTGLVSVASVLLTGCEDTASPSMQLSHYISCFTKLSMIKKSQKCQSKPKNKLLQS